MVSPGTDTVDRLYHAKVGQIAAATTGEKILARRITGSWGM